MKFEKVTKIDINRSVEIGNNITHYIKNLPKPGKSVGLRGNDYIMFYLKKGDIIVLQEDDDIMPMGLSSRTVCLIRAWWAGESGGNEEVITKDYMIQDTRYNGEHERTVYKKKSKKRIK